MRRLRARLRTTTIRQVSRRVDQLPRWPTSVRQNLISQTCSCARLLQNRLVADLLFLKVPTFIYPHLQGNPDQQRFTIRRGVLPGNDTRWRSAISGCPLLKRTDFGSRSLQLDRPSYAPASRTMASARDFLRQRLTRPTLSTAWAIKNVPL